MGSFFSNMVFRMGSAAKKRESGMGVIEIILIIVVLISLVLIFKSELTGLVKTIFGNISNNALSI